MDIKFKKLSDKAVMPVRAHEGDAGIDLVCTDITQEINECGQLMLVYHTDLAVEIPEGHVGLLFPRSSIAKKSLALSNSVGVIDSGYRGEIMAKMRSTTDVVPAIYKPGDRFSQLLVMPLLQYNIVEAEELTETDRGDGGYGSSDNKIDSAAKATEDVPTLNEPAVDLIDGSEIAE